MLTSPPFPPYFSYQHPLVRDLCWTLSPEFDLLGALPPYHRFVPPHSHAQLRLWLDQLERAPELLEAFMAADTRKRLGHHFERLVLFYLAHAPGSTWEVLDHNLGIYGENSAGHRITLGELDFLLASSDGSKNLHLETAVKFFLGVEHAGEVFWLGPGLKDRLNRKLRHLREHQLPLSQRVEAETCTPIERCFWLKGILFQPWREHLPIAAGLLQPSVENVWLTCSEALAIGEADDWVGLPKSRWLGCGWEDLSGNWDNEINAAGLVAPQESLMTEGHIRRHFARGNRVLMLTHRTSAKRRLIVADDWPAAARAALDAHRD